MIFNYRYGGETKVNSSSSAVGVSFAPDTLREPTYFIGKLNRHLSFREAISALHEVVVSDLRFKPRERTEYKAWLAEQEPLWLAEALAQKQALKQEIDLKTSELKALRQQRDAIMGPFYKARSKYFNYLYERDRDMWVVLDPVISVHPDEVFFECFSQDESTYGKLSCDYEVFKNIDEFKCGTTNIDYSSALYEQFQKIRTYKETEFKIDPAGFEVQTGRDDGYREVKIDLPDSWVRGFLQVSSAMTMPARTLSLHPMDMHNLLFILKRHKEKEGPRAMRFHLNPGQPIRVVFEPWNYEVVCDRSPYTGHEPDEIRVWGRRRLLILERLLPVAKRFTVTLLGTGMPSFYEADLGDMQFTLGLSGWTANDWSRMGNFDLLAPRREVDAITQQQVYQVLKEIWQESADSLAQRLQLDKSMVLGALTSFVQAGRAIYDRHKDVYRIRELRREELPVAELRFANLREEFAHFFVKTNRVKLGQIDQQAAGVKIRGRVEDKGREYEPVITIDRDERLVQPSCTCNFYQQHKLFKGPCEHMLALRMRWGQKVAEKN
ncbi:hypothetical protein D770_23270 [Flammeovirgaceae bacterium 311]|nr:hypothetical protein D770_23270 [Flammeovirgaceae bacterium 311]